MHFKAIGEYKPKTPALSIWTPALLFSSWSTALLSSFHHPTDLLIHSLNNTPSLLRPYIKTIVCTRTSLLCSVLNWNTDMSSRHTFNVEGVMFLLHVLLFLEIVQYVNTIPCNVLSSQTGAKSQFRGWKVWVHELNTSRKNLTLLKESSSKCSCEMRPSLLCWQNQCILCSLQYPVIHLFPLCPQN